MSATVSPPSSRRVRATRFSGARAGWQHVKISRSRSSRTGPVSSGGESSMSMVASAYFESRLASRLSRSSALFAATVVSQAPGLGGSPSRGHRSTATSSASEVASSAMSRSPNRRASAATTRPCSARKTSSSSGKRSGGLGLEGADLDLARAGGGAPLGPVESLVEVGCLDDPETAEVLLGLRERSVGDQALTLGVVHRGRALDQLQAPGED